MSVPDAPQRSSGLMAQLCWLREGGTVRFREPLAKACLELMIREIDLALCGLDGLNALKKERGLRHEGSELL